MTNKNLISKSIIISSVLITVLLVLLTTYIGYRLPFVHNMTTLIREVRLFNESGVLTSKLNGLQLDKNNITGGIKAEIDLDMSGLIKFNEELALYLTPIQNPIQILQDGRVVKEIGDFKKGKPLTEQDFAIDLKDLNLSKLVVLRIEKNIIKGSELEFIFNSGIAANNKISNMRLARSILVIYGYLAMSALFFSFFILITVIWLNANTYKYFGALALSFLGQSWIAFYFSRIWIQSNFSTIINLNSFIIYFLSLGFLLLSFQGKVSVSNEKWNPFDLTSLPVIFYFSSALIMLVGSILFNMPFVMSIYKTLLTTSLFILTFFIINFIMKTGKVKSQDRFTLILSLIIILFGQLNDILRVHSKIFFMYNIGPYAFFLASLILIANAINILQQRFLLSLENEKYFAIFSVAQEVSHDIRSPISALNMVVGQLQNIPEEQRLLIRHSVNRINDIANSLLEKGRIKGGINAPTDSNINLDLKIEMLGSLVEVLVSEKRTQFKNKPNVDIEAILKNSYGAFIKTNTTELKRVLSNLITNAVEALEDNVGLIQISVTQESGQSIICIEDNGKGIPESVLVKLGERGVTHGKSGKESGSGLGVYHAKKTVESFGGTFSLDSKVGIGTVVKMSFPAEPPPEWFVSEINISSNQKVVICDDDSSIHGLWSERLKRLGSETHELHFSSDEAISNWFIHSSIDKNFIFLMDFELLGSAKNGLDIIESLNLSPNAILVTSRYEEQNIRDRCKKLGVKIIPKGMAEFTPIIVDRPKKKFDTVLIDDDELVRMMWEFAAKDSGVSILTFESFESFEKNSQNISRETPISVDMNLGGGIHGTDIAFKIHNMGFKSIYLATGIEPNGIENVPACVVAVRGKDPIFT